MLNNTIDDIDDSEIYVINTDVNDIEGVAHYSSGNVYEGDWENGVLSFSGKICSKLTNCIRKTFDRRRNNGYDRI